MHELKSSPKSPLLDSSQSKSDLRSMRGEEILLPQVFESLFSVVQYSKSLDQVHRCFIRIHRCFSDTDPSAADFMDEIHSHNLEAFFSVRDWLLLLCDIVAKFRRPDSTEELEALALLSLSEPESLVSGDLRRYDSFRSAGESEEGFSTAGDSIADDGSNDLGSFHRFSATGRRTPLDQMNRRHHVAQFTAPVLNLIRKLLLLDMFMKCNGSRRWLEVFRLSLPETSQIQEEVVLDLINTMHHASFLVVSKEACMNYLKNMGAFLEQALEKMIISLHFCISVVSALHALSYRCCLELRAKLRDTALPEVKKSFIVRCFIDIGQDIGYRVHSLVEIRASLHAYIATNDGKLLSDSQIVILLLGMLEECFDNLEAAIASSTQSVEHDSTLSSRSLDVVTAATEMMQALVTIIQVAGKLSNECRRTLGRVVEGIASDSEKRIEKCLLSSEGAAKDASVGSEELDAQGKQTASSSGSTWWSSWARSADVSKSLEVDSKEEAAAPDVTEAVAPTRQEKALEAATSTDFDVRSFVYWYCAAAQRLDSPVSASLC